MAGCLRVLLTLITGLIFIYYSDEYFRVPSCGDGRAEVVVMFRATSSDQSATARASVGTHSNLEHSRVTPRFFTARSNFESSVFESCGKIVRQQQKVCIVFFDKIWCIFLFVYCYIVRYSEFYSGSKGKKLLSLKCKVHFFFLYYLAAHRGRVIFFLYYVFRSGQDY